MKQEDVHVVFWKCFAVCSFLGLQPTVRTSTSNPGDSGNKASEESSKESVKCFRRSKVKISEREKGKKGQFQLSSYGSCYFLSTYLM